MLTKRIVKHERAALSHKKKLLSIDLILKTECSKNSSYTSSSFCLKKYT